MSTRNTDWRERLGALRWVLLSLAVILLDQITKAAITARLELFDIITVLPVLEITHLHNTGAAFSFLAGAAGWQRWFFIGLAGVVAIVILVWLQRLPRRGQQVLAAGLALIMGGAVGNVIDRIAYGHVIDFLDFHFGGWHWPAFNLADSAIVGGAALLIVDELRRVRRAR
jgi:signal peptidase II